MIRLHPHRTPASVPPTPASNGDDGDDDDSTASQCSSAFAARSQDAKEFSQQPQHSISLPQGFWLFSIPWAAASDAFSVIRATDKVASYSGESAEWLGCLWPADPKSCQWHLTSHEPGEGAAQNDQYWIVSTAAERASNTKDEQPELKSSVGHRVADRYHPFTATIVRSTKLIFTGGQSAEACTRVESRQLYEIIFKHTQSTQWRWEQSSVTIDHTISAPEPIFVRTRLICSYRVRRGRR